MMLGEEQIYGYGGIVTGLVGMYQANHFHNKEKERALARHQEAIKLAKEQHAKDLKIVKQTYLLQIFNSLEQHFQQLNADLIASSKESERDMFDQRNQSFQTIILSSSVMFSALTTVIVQGFLPKNSGDFLFIAYSLTSSLSFAFLFLCIVICIEIIMRATSFMYDRANKHTKQLRDAIKKTKDMMRKLRRDGANGTSTSASNFNINANTSGSAKNTGGDNGGNVSPGENQSGKHNSPAPRLQYRRGISGMTPDALEHEWEQHEAEVQKYLYERGEINDQTAVVGNVSAGDASQSGKKSFQQFWEESCRFWAYIAILFFYAGSLNLLLAIMIYMWAEFFLVYSSLVGAVIAVTLVGLSVVVGLVIVVVLRRHDKYHIATTDTPMSRRVNGDSNRAHPSQSPDGGSDGGSFLNGEEHIV